LFRRLKLEYVGRELGPTTVRSLIASAFGSLIATGVLWLPTTAAWWLAVILGAAAYTVLMLAMKDKTWRSMVLRHR
jgi:hypothetical protein